MNSDPRLSCPDQDLVFGPARSAFALERHVADHRNEALACTLDYIVTLAGAVGLELDEFRSDFPGASDGLNLATSMLNLIGDQAGAAMSALGRETVQ